VANFWRAVKADPGAVTYHADWPVNENDLHARHSWLVGHRDDVTARLDGDPDYFNAKIAGWWVWGMACWIGSGFCSGKGPWQSVELPDGSRHLVHLGNAGQGVNRQLVHLGDAGRGAGDGECGLLEWMLALGERFERVRVCCGDWERVCGDTPTIKMGTTAVLMDPPYGDAAERAKELYSAEDDLTVAAKVRQWCKERGGDKRYRIALCGYDVEHTELEAMGWDVFEWSTSGGYASQGDPEANTNRKRERIWFSPHCLPVERQIDLFDGEEVA